MYNIMYVIYYLIYKQEVVILLNATNIIQRDREREREGGGRLIVMFDNVKHTTIR